jgi:hypothetical protein
MLRLIVIAITVLAAARAWADLPEEPALDHRIGLAVHIGGISDISGDQALELEGAWHYAGGTWLRVAVSSGVPLPVESGRVLEGRFGVERRRETCGRGCFYTGIDLALVAADVQDEPDQTTLRGLFAIGRAGLDGGSGMLRFRLGVDVWLGAGRVRIQEPEHMPAIDETTTRFLKGFAFTGGISALF